MDTATRVQILDETDCISRSTNTLGKGMNPVFFYRNQMLNNYELDENILKTLIKRNVFPPDSNKKNKSYHIQ